jgi:hypothetical protein
MWKLEAQTPYSIHMVSGLPLLGLIALSLHNLDLEGSEKRSREGEPDPFSILVYGVAHSILHLFPLYRKQRDRDLRRLGTNEFLYIEGETRGAISTKKAHYFIQNCILDRHFPISNCILHNFKCSLDLGIRSA